MNTSKSADIYLAVYWHDFRGDEQGIGFSNRASLLQLELTDTAIVLLEKYFG
jgi:hypothetical protein